LSGNLYEIVDRYESIPDHISYLVVSALNQFKKYLDEGALITIDEKKFRARILPLRK